MHKFSILHTDACIGRLSGSNHVPSIIRVGEQSESLLKVYTMWSGIRVCLTGTPIMPTENAGYSALIEWPVSRELAFFVWTDSQQQWQMNITDHFTHCPCMWGNNSRKIRVLVYVLERFLFFTFSYISNMYALCWYVIKLLQNSNVTYWYSIPGAVNQQKLL